MNPTKLFQRLARALLLSVIFALTACASGPTLVNHSFGFDVLADSPEAFLLEYRYGTSTHPGASGSPSKSSRPDGVIRQGAGVSGDMILGDTLYVKWRLKATGEVLEDTVDLKSRLPRDITDHRIYFVLKQRQLWVYLVSPERRPPDFPIVGPRKFDFYKVFSIYPTSTLNQ